MAQLRERLQQLGGSGAGKGGAVWEGNLQGGFVGLGLMLAASGATGSMGQHAIQPAANGPYTYVQRQTADGAHMRAGRVMVLSPSGWQGAPAYGYRTQDPSTAWTAFLCVAGQYQLLA